MTKAEFLKKAAELYRFGNLQDTDQKADWTAPSMSADVCGALDSMLTDLLSEKVLSYEEYRAFYDNL